MLSIKNTFIHVQDEEPAPRRRSHSAPASARFDGSPTKPLRSKRKGKRNTRRWADLVRKRVEIDAARQVEEARSMRRLRIDGHTPKLRVVLDARVYLNFKYRVFAIVEL